MKKLVLLFALITPFLLMSQSEDPQKKSFKDLNQLFKAYVSAGLNVNQIDGDGLGGYKSFGAQGGVGVFVMYTDKLSNSLEINYSMNGARSLIAKPKNPSAYHVYEMDYINVPIMFNYHDFKFAIFSVGFAYNQSVRQFFYRGDPKGVEKRTNKFSNVNVPFYSWNIDMLAGFTFLIKDHWGINFRYNYSLLNNLKNGTKRGSVFSSKQTAKQSTNYIQSNPSSPGINWFHNTITIRVQYVF